MTVGEIRKRSVEYLTGRGISDPRIDSDYIISWLLGIRPGELPAKSGSKVPFFKKIVIENSVRQRGRNKPVAYILGYKYFYLDKFLVNRRSLIPRADTEHLIYAAVENGAAFKNILDVGTGSGALAMSLSRIFPKALIRAVDRDISIAARNKKALDIKNVTLIKTDFIRNGDGLKGEKAWLYDLIISNPPYLSSSDMKKLGKDALLYEPRKAFYGGIDGLDFYRKISSFAVSRLGKGGSIIVETDYKWRRVLDIFLKSGMHEIRVLKDYGGLERVIEVRKDF